jgi:hypothetical protein
MCTVISNTVNPAICNHCQTPGINAMHDENFRLRLCNNEVACEMFIDQVYQLPDHSVWTVRWLGFNLPVLSSTSPNRAALRPPGRSVSTPPPTLFEDTLHANNNYFSLLVYSMFVRADGVVWIQSICVMIGERNVCFDNLSQLSLAKSAWDHRWQNRWYKYECLWAYCNAVLDGKNGAQL